MNKQKETKNKVRETKIKLMVGLTFLDFRALQMLQKYLCLKNE